MAQSQFGQRRRTVHNGLVGRARPAFATRHDTDALWESTKAAFRGGFDSLPFNLGNVTPASVHAIGAALRLQDPRAAYSRQAAAEEQSDRYDEQHHPTARMVGKVTGTVGQMAVPGMTLLRSGRGIARLAKATRAIGKEYRSVAGIGAVGGVGSQGVTDIIRGKPSSVADYVGTAAGGSVGTVAAMLGRPGIAGALEGAATSLAQDVLNGRVQSWADIVAAGERARDAATAGNAAGGTVGRIVAARINKFKPVLKAGEKKLKTNKSGMKTGTPPNKGELGEKLSSLRSWARGETILTNAPHRAPLSRSYWVPDSHTVPFKVESKFGYGAKLTKNQKRAVREDPHVRIDHFLPRDVGIAAELPAAFAAYQASRPAFDAQDPRAGQGGWW